MSKLLERLRKNTIVKAEILKNSKYFAEGRRIPTRIPLLNLALSGSVKDGGLPKGIIQIAAPPAHFKTNFMMELMFAFQQEHQGKDYIIVLYDSELGSTLSYYEKMGLDTTRIDHRPIKSVEELRSDCANLLNDSQEGDAILVCVDSIGMLRSNKETDDAVSGKDAADFTRAKAIKSFFRIITAESAIKGIPFVVVNHSYQTMELYAKEVAGGGRGAQYAAHTLWFITKAQQKDGDELEGFRFTVRAGKSRYIKENSTFPIIVRFDEGIYKYSGLFDLAEELGYIEVASKGWYWADKEKTRKVRASELEGSEEFMEGLLNNPEFLKQIEDKYKL